MSSRNFSSILFKEAADDERRGAAANTAFLLECLQEVGAEMLHSEIPFPWCCHCTPTPYGGASLTGFHVIKISIC